MLRRMWLTQALPAGLQVGHRPSGTRGWIRGLPCSHSHCSLGPRQECLSRLLSPCGPVQSVELHAKPDLTERPKEPRSQFFDPKPVPVSLQVLGSVRMGTGVGLGHCPQCGRGKWCPGGSGTLRAFPGLLGQSWMYGGPGGRSGHQSLHSFPQVGQSFSFLLALSIVLGDSSESISMWCPSGPPELPVCFPH